MVNKKTTTDYETTPEKVPLFCSHRLILAFLASLGFFLCYAQRNGFSVSIVCMVNPDADNVTSTYNDQPTALQRNIPASCHKHTIHKSRSLSQVLYWPKTTRGILLGSFYWGYALTQIASSLAVNYFGPKFFVALLVLISSISTVLMPIFSTIHSSAVIFLRVLAGAAQGGLWPTTYRFWSTWAPASERSTLLSVQSSGPSLGTVISLIIGGLFCTFSFDNAVPFIFRYGWTYFFYVFGGLGILWSILWIIFASDTPVNNRHMSTKEKEYIRACKAEEKLQNPQTKVPWGPMFRSQSFWCLLISLISFDFGVFAIWTVVPEYMNEVLLFSIEENGLLSALPDLACFMIIIVTGRLADYIIEQKYLKRVNARKLYHGIGALVSAICLLLISFLDCQRRYLAVFLLVIARGFNGFCLSGGFMVNAGDFSGIHSGVVFGICNTISSIGGFGAPYVTSLITKHKSATEWRIAFMLYSASFFVSAIVFAIFARGETEPWARDDVHDEQITKDPDANKELMDINPKDLVI